MSNFFYPSFRFHLRNWVKYIASGLGFIVNRNSSSSNSYLQIALALRNFHIFNVVDVGANLGQFSTDLIRSSSGLSVFAVEPIPSCHSFILKHFRHQKNISVYPSPVAVSCKQGTASFYIANSLASSSLLRPDSIINDKHNISSQNLSSTLNVETVTLDHILNWANIYSDDYMLKLDIQGYEFTLLEHIFSQGMFPRLVFLETSLITTYENEFGFYHVQDLFHRHNYHLFSINQSLASTVTGATIQMNVMYSRDPQCHTS